MIELKTVKNYLAPLPVILVTSRLQENNIKKDNIIAISWAGICDHAPHLININIAKGRYSGKIIKLTREFGVCMPTSKYIKEIDLCGTTHGNKVNKFELTKFTSFEAKTINVPLINECPINMECTLEDVVSFESHEMLIGKIVKTHIDENYIEDKGNPDFAKIGIVAYLNSEYWTLGKKIEDLFFTLKK